MIDHLDAKEYVETFMCALTNGDHAVFEDCKVTIVSDICWDGFSKDESSMMWSLYSASGSLS